MPGCAAQKRHAHAGCRGIRRGLPAIAGTSKRAGESVISRAPRRVTRVFFEGALAVGPAANVAAVPGESGLSPLTV
jgi:hypothetical protein